jgi:hypothetical protein
MLIAVSGFAWLEFASFSRLPARHGSEAKSEPFVNLKTIAGRRSEYIAGGVQRPMYIYLVPAGCSIAGEGNGEERVAG